MTTCFMLFCLMALQGAEGPHKHCRYTFLLKKQIESVVKSNAFLHLHLAWKLAPCLDTAGLAMLIHAMVTAKLDSCNVFYTGLSLTAIQNDPLAGWCNL